MNLYERFFNAVKAGKSEDVSASIDKLIESDPCNPNHYIKKGDIYQKNGNSVEAIKLYHKAADLMLQGGFNKKAFAVLKIILRIDPADQVALHNMENVITEIGGAEINIPSGKRDAVDYSDDASRGVFFAGLNNEEVKRILDRAEVREFADGETIIKEGDSGDSIYIIKGGNARVISFFMGRQVELAVLQRSGDIFGEVSFLTGRPRSASVIAEGHLVVYEISRQNLEDILQLKTKLTEYLNEIYHVRIVETINKIKGKTDADCKNY